MFVRTIRRAVLVAALGALTPVTAHGETPSGASQGASDEQVDAEGLAERAFEAYSKGDYSAALQLYQQALQGAPAAALYFNIASIYDKKLEDPQLAIDFYRKCISAPDATPELTLKSTARIQALKEQSSQKPAASVLPRAGAAQGGSSAAPAPRADESQAPSSSLRTAGLVVGGIGIAGLAAGLGVGFAAKSKLDSAKEVCDGRNCRSQAGVDDMNSASTLAKVSTIACIAGSGVLGAGLVLYLLSPKKVEASSPATSAGIRLAPAVGAGEAGVVLSGVFF